MWFSGAHPLGASREVKEAFGGFKNIISPVLAEKYALLGYFNAHIRSRLNQMRQREMKDQIRGLLVP